MSDPVMNVLQEMLKLFSQLPLEAQELFEQNVYERRVKRNNSSCCSDSTFKDVIGLCRKYGFDYQSSSVDLREHHTHLRTVPDKNRSIGFMKYSRADWEKLHPPGSEHYINRLRAGDFKRYFLAAGFEIGDFSATQRMDTTDAVYGDIDPAFHPYPLEDLKTPGVQAILKKGGR